MSKRIALIDGGEVCFRVSAGSQIVRYRFYAYKEKEDGWLQEFRYAKDSEKWLKKIGHNPEDPIYERHKFVTGGSDDVARLNADRLVRAIMEGSKADYLLLCFGHPTRNFRHDVATIQRYKAGRGSRPPQYDVVREHLMDKYPYYEATTWLEDDDVMASFQTQLAEEPNLESIICTQDKDLLQVPGLHYNTKKGELFEVSVVQGLRAFYKQLISGDTTDTIPGIFQITGKRNSAKFAEHIDDVLQCPEDEYKAWIYVRDLYAEGFGPSDYDVPAILTEIGNLLYMRRNWRDKWAPPV